MIAAGLLSLINIGSSVVLNIILSLVLEGFFASYLISLSLLLYRRWRGDIAAPREDGGPGQEPFLWGPFRLKGWIGLANNIFAIVFTVIMMFFGCWPPKTNPSPADMNYSIVIFGGVTILAVVYYLGWARKFYHGPVIEV